MTDQINQRNGGETIWWHASAKKWLTSPEHTIDEAVVEAFDD